MQKTFLVAVDFNIDSFLSACRSAGVKLSAEVEGEAIDGFLEKTGQSLGVYLNTPSQAKMDIVEGILQSL